MTLQKRTDVLDCSFVIVVENEVSTPASRPPGREKPTLKDTDVVIELEPKEL